MPQFDITTYWSQIFWLILSFGTLFLALSRVIIPRFKAMLLRREVLIEQDQSKTKELNDQQQEKQRQRLHRLEQAKEKAYELVSKTVLKMDAFEEKRMQEIHEQINHQLKDFQVSLEQEKKSLEKDIEALVQQSVHHLLPKLLVGEKG